MSAKDLERNDERILHEVIVDCSVKDMDRAVVGGAGKERKYRMIGNRSQCSTVIARNDWLSLMTEVIGLTEEF